MFLLISIVALYALSLHRARSSMSLFCSILYFVWYYAGFLHLLHQITPLSTGVLHYVYNRCRIPVSDIAMTSSRQLLALEQINNRTDILPNYTLSYRTIRDSKVNTIQCGNALARFIIFMLVRCDCFFECSMKILLMSRCSLIPPFLPSLLLPLYL